MPIQKIITDDEGEAIQVIDRVGQVYREIPKVAMDMVSAYDPVLGQTVDVSIAGLGELITDAAAKFMAEDFDGSIDDAKLVWVDE